MSHGTQTDGDESIGIDGEGAKHNYDADQRIVRVYAPTGELEHEQHLDDRPVADWIDYVAHRRGWRERRFLTARDLFGRRETVERSDTQ
ncbi:MAG: hypothetical protein SVG88_13060 [Halobacteriales archaeon]|nr:hypothetical protein [Halobacteriales archaeon]